jgi:predicted ATP-dependent endonuclease of OLD family
MFTQIQDYVSDNTSAIVDHMAKLRQESADNVREAFSSSADSLKSLKSPVRTLARSGIKLTNVAQSTTQSLIELQSDVVTATITDAAKRLERAARASNIVDLVQAQVDMLPATRTRIVEDAQRAVDIFKTTGKDLRGVASYTYDRIIKPVEDELPTVKVTKKKTKRAAAKTKRKAKSKTKRASTKTKSAARKAAA